MKIPDAFKDLLEGPVYATLTTLMPDGAPHATVVWADYDGEHVRVNTARGRQKDKNVQADRRVSLMAIDPENPFRWISITGEVEDITEDGAKDHIDALAKLYVGVPSYYGNVAPADHEGKETRVMFKIKPLKVLTFATE